MTRFGERYLRIANEREPPQLDVTFRPGRGLSHSRGMEPQYLEPIIVHGEATSLIPPERFSENTLVEDGDMLAKLLGRIGGL